ncbi:hypothetical protein K443DRAFT_407394 [Laccaria amethystina LaAM-08-1]|uniref:Uncharacterized protein n=1 Tax=Laccaria amethystina LaAM-08-1 TaxID=1095629 RepID=A0A0C9X6G9_9AGAR|nr:hypothetical protein K443DRAFT_407394 [Laccaria amethystina LaAM-08-1]
MDVLGRIAISLREEYSPDKPRIPSPYIEYRSLPSLLEDFRLRLAGFLQAQSYHFMCSSNGVDGPPRALFGFDGEFSVVALDLDVPGRKADVEGEVLRLKGEVERLGRMQFSPKRMVSIFDFGIITRFVCMHKVPMLKPVVIQPGGAPTPAYSKTMQGELEISVLADKTHRFLPGQRTIVRFRLIG